MFDPVGLANHVEAHWPGVDGVAVSRLLCELNAVVCQNGMHLIRHTFEHVLQELPGCLPVCLLDKLGHGKFACAVNADEQVKLALSGLHLGDVDMEEADRVALELLALRLVAFHVRQSRDAMSLQAPMQRRTRQMWDGRLQSIETIVQRQQCMPSERDDGRFLGLS